MKKPQQQRSLKHSEKKGHSPHRSGKEKRAEDKKKLVGSIRTTGKGMGFVSVDGMEEAVIIEPDFVNHALNGDEVEIILTGKYFDPKSKQRGGKEGLTGQAGQVVKIIQRAKKQFVGVLVQKEGRVWLMPDDRKMYVHILVPQAKPEEIGKKVLVRIYDWKPTESFPSGEVVQVLGEKGDHETEIQSIILDRGIDTHFPPEVDKEAEEIGKFGKPLPKAEIATRVDFRDTTTFTIDPVDAKDFDDALSIKDVGNGEFEIGVHIADVSHYVREGTALDREAQKRSFSVYLVDRTIPMLPEVLSNDLCSLNPNEDRFAFSAVFKMSMNGEIKTRWFGKTVIHSNKRFSYEAAQDILNAGTGELYSELNTLNTIAKTLKQQNYAAGAIEFEQEEVRFKLDEHGKPIDVYKKARLDTHKLIEEFMLLANREVAKFIYDNTKDTHSAGIYRIHDLPNEERIEELALFLKALGFHLPVRQGKVSSQDINKLLDEVSGSPEESLIKTATIRSMAKAIYSPKNIGHFGLGFEFYTHFTSPIRRYPDLMVHRILFTILTNNKSKVKDEYNLFRRISEHATEREIAAAEAERASIKYKQVEYMSEHIGEEFDGIISGVTDWGIYVEEVRTKCEGMISLRELGDDFYIFNRKSYTVEGQKTKKKYRLGDKVRFKVTKADLDAKTLDYKMVQTA
jgi:ribonuclease R